MATNTTTIKFTGQFDTSQITKGLQDIKKQVTNANISDELKKQFENAFNKLQVNIPALEKLTSKEEFNLKDIQALQKLLKEVTKDWENLNKVTDQIDLSKTFSAKDLEKINNLNKQIKDTRQNIENARKELIDSFTKENTISSKSKNISNALTELFTVNPDEIDNKFNEIKQQFTESYQNTQDELKNKIESAKIFKDPQELLKHYFGEDSGVTYGKGMTKIKDEINAIIRSYREFKKANDEAGMAEELQKLQQVLNNSEKFKMPEGESWLGLPTQEDLNILNQIGGLLEKIKTSAEGKEVFFTEEDAKLIELIKQRTEAYSEATKNASKQQKDYVENINNTGDGIKTLADKTKDAETELQRLQRQGEALEQTFGSLARRIENSVSALAVFNKSTQIIRQAIKSVEDLDAAFTQIAIVSEQSSEEAWRMFDSFNKLAKQYSITTKDLAEGAKLFYQQGLNAADTMKMVEASTVSAALGEVTMTEAANTLTAAIQGYNESAAVAMDYTDKIAMVGAVSAADFNELSTAMEKTASSAYTAGIDFDHLLGYLGKMIEVTREAPANLGTAMKTIIARFEDMKKDPLAVLEDGVSANKVEEALATIGIALRDSEGEFRALQDVMDELGIKWETLTRNQQAYIATVAAGSRQQSRFLAMMNDYDRTLDLIAESQNSAGAAAQQYAIYQDSVAAAQARLTASWENFYSKIVDNDLIKTAINGMANLIDSLSEIPPIITAIGAALGALELQNVFKIIRSNESGVTKLAGGFKDLYEASKGNEKSFRELMQTSPKLIDVFKSLKIGAEGIGSTIIGATKAIGSFVAANAWWFVGGIAIAGIIALITSHLTAQKQAYEENVKTIKAYQNEANELNSKINNAENLLESYEDLASKIDRTTEEQNELNNIIKEISDIYPQATHWVDEYGNEHLENIDYLKKEIALEKELAQDKQRSALRERESLLNKPVKDWKEEDFNQIGFSTGEVSRFFDNQEQLNFLNGLDKHFKIYNLNKVNDYFNNIKLPDTDRFSGAINVINNAIDKFNLKIPKLSEYTRNWDEIFHTKELIEEFRENIPNAIMNLEEQQKQLREKMIRDNSTKLSFLDLIYSEKEGTATAQKMISAKLESFITSLGDEAYQTLMDSLGGKSLTEVLQNAIDNVTSENGIKLKELTDKFTEGVITPEEMNEFYQLLGLTAGEGFAEGLEASLEKKKEKIRQDIIEAVKTIYGDNTGGVDLNNLTSSNETLTTMVEMPSKDYNLNAAQALQLAPVWEKFQKKLEEASKTGNFKGITESIEQFANDFYLTGTLRGIFEQMARDGLDDAINGISDKLSQEIQENMDSLTSIIGKDYSSIDISEAMGYADKFGSSFLDHASIDKNGKVVLDTYAQMLAYEEDMQETRNKVNDLIDKLIVDYELLEDKESDEAKNLKDEIRSWEKIRDSINKVEKEFDGLLDLTEEINKNTKAYDKNLKELGESAQNNADALKFSSDIASDYEGVVKTTKELEKQMKDIGSVSRETMDQLTAYGPAYQDFFTIDEGQIYFNLENIVGDYANAAEAVIDIARKQQEAQIEAKKIEMDAEIEYAEARADGYEKLANLLDEYTHEVILNEHNMTDEERGQLQQRITNEVKTHQTALDNAKETYNKHKTMAGKLYEQLAELDATYWANIGKENVQDAVRNLYNGLGSIHEVANLKAPDLLETNDPSKILEAANNYRNAAKGLRSYADSLKVAKERLKVIDPTIYNDLAEKMEAAGKSGSDGIDKLTDLILKATEAIENLDNLVKELNADLADINLDYNFFGDLFEAWEHEWDYYYNIKRLIVELGQQGQFIDNIISADFVSADQKVSGYHAKIGNLIAQMAANDTYITSLRTGMSQTALELMKDYGEYYKINPDTGQIYQTDKNLNEINTTINAAKEELYNLSKVQNTRQNDLNLENSKLEALEKEKSAYESILSEVESQIDSYKNLDDIIVDTSELEVNRSAIKAKIEISDESIEAQKEKIREMEDEIQNFEIEIELKGNVESKLEEYVDKMEEKVQEYEEYWDTLNSTIEQQQEILSQLNDVFKYYIDTAISTEQEIYNAIVENYQDEINKKKQQYDYLKQLDKDYLASVRENINRERQAREDANKQKSYQQSLQRMQLLQQDTSGAYRNELAQLGKEVEDKRQELYDDLVDKQVEALEKEIDKRHELYDKEIAALEERLAYMQENAILLWETVNSIVAEGAEAMMSQLETTTNYINSNELSKEKQRSQWEQNIKITYDGVTNNQINNIKAMVEKGKDYINSLQEIRSAMETNINTYQNSTQILIENNANFQSAMDAFMSEWNRITNRFTSYYESWEQTVEILKAALDNNIQALINMNNEGGSIKELDRTLRDSAKDMYDDFISERERYRSELEGLINQIRTEISAAIKDAANAIRGAATSTGVNPNSDTNSNNGSNNTNFVNNPNGNNINGQGNEPKFKLNVWGPDGTSHLSSETKTSSEWQQWIQSARAANGEKSLAGIPWPYKQWRGSEYYRMYKQGGLADYTGLAWLDGTSSNPERILSPRQTKLFESMVHSLEKSTNSNINSGLGSSYNIGDINTTIQVDRLDNETDVNKLVKQVEDKILKTIRNRVVVSV